MFIFKSGMFISKFIANTWNIYVLVSLKKYQCRASPVTLVLLHWFCIPTPECCHLQGKSKGLDFLQPRDRLVPTLRLITWVHYDKKSIIKRNSLHVLHKLIKQLKGWITQKAVFWMGRSLLKLSIFVDWRQTC